jgi:hypothetical protein
MFGFDLESLKMDFSNPMLWAGLVLMVVAIAGYFWMTYNKEEPTPQNQSVSFAPTAQVMEIPSNSQQAQQQYQEQQYQQEQYQQQQQQQEQQQQFEDQPTVATCIVNDAGEQVCA